MAQSVAAAGPRVTAVEEAPRLSLASLPAVLAVALLLLATLYDGAFDVRHWGPPAIFALVMLAVVVGRGGLPPLTRPIALSLAAVWAFAAWTLLSTIWAVSPGQAWEGGGRALFYAALVTVALVAIPTAREMRTIGALVIAGISAFALFTLARMHLEGPDLFVAGRLDTPLGYRNATACLFGLAFWPLIGAAVTRGRNPTLRAAVFSAAVLVLGLAFLTQSRGVILGVAAGGVVALVLGTERIRRAFLAILAAGGVLMLSGPLLTAYRAFENPPGPVTPGDVATATNAVTFLFVDAFIIGLLLALLDGGLRASLENLQRARRVAVVGLVVGAVGLVAGSVAAAGNPIEFVTTKVDEFQAIQSRSSEVTRVLSTGGQRYDLWRVAWDEFAANPLLGVGEDSYAAGYYLERGTDRNLSDPHSLPLRLLAETGLVGTLLFAVFLGALGFAIVQGVRGATLSTRHAVAGLAAAGTVVLGQALVDWIWMVPGVTGIGLLCLALAAGIVSRESRPATSAPPIVRRVARGLGAAALIAAAASVLFVFLSDFYVRQARAAESPAAMVEAARTAERLDPLALAPRYEQASALESVGQLDAARAELRGALELEPRSFATLALLGDLEARAGDEAAAARYYGEASLLNPRDVGLLELKRAMNRRARADRRPDAAADPTSRGSPSRG